MGCILGSGILATPMSRAEHDIVSRHWVSVCSVAHGLNGREIMWVLFEFFYKAERAQFCLDRSKAIDQSARQNTLMRTGAPGEPDLHPT